MRLLSDHTQALVRLDPARTAVLAIHWQNDVLDPAGAFGPAFAGTAAAAGLVPRARRLFDAVRRAGSQLIYLNVAYQPGHPEAIQNSALFRTARERQAFVRGTRGAQVVDALAPQPGDVVLEHGRISGFYGTELDLHLRARGIDTLVVTGMATNVAVDHTVRDAVQLGYRTVLLEDCCSSADAAHHEAALMTLRVLASHVVTCDDFLERLA